MLMVAYIVSLTRRTQGQHHHQADDVEMTLFTIDQESHYVLGGPSDDGTVLCLNGWSWWTDETYRCASFVSGANAESEAMMAHENFSAFRCAFCGCSCNVECRNPRRIGTIDG